MSGTQGPGCISLSHEGSSPSTCHLCFKYFHHLLNQMPLSTAPSVLNVTLPTCSAQLSRQEKRSRAQLQPMGDSSAHPCWISPSGQQFIKNQKEAFSIFFLFPVCADWFTKWSILNYAIWDTGFLGGRVVRILLPMQETQQTQVQSWSRRSWRRKWQPTHFLA